MSNSFESRKPRAEAKVRDLAQENERLQLALREEQARHDAKVADGKAMEKRIGELRREMDTAAALHREVKARLEGEIERLQEDGLHLWIDERARLAAENTRLGGAVESARDAIAKVLRILEGINGQKRQPEAVHSANVTRAVAAMSNLRLVHAALYEAAPPASDKSPDYKPAGSQ